MINFGNTDARLGQHIGDGVTRKIRVVLAARKAFFLGCRDYLAIPHQAGGSIVIVGGDAEDGRHQNW